MWKYCAKEDVSDFTGISADRLRDSWSTMAEDLIDEHVGESYSAPETYTESIDGDGSDTIFLNNHPVVSVSSLAIGDVQVSSSQYEVYSSGYIRLVHSLGSPIVEAMNSPASSFPVGQQNVAVTYSAGVSSVPGRVRFAAILMIIQMSLVRERAGADGSLSISMAGGKQAGERDRSLYGTDISGKMRHIMRTTIGHRWDFA